MHVFTCFTFALKKKEEKKRRVIFFSLRRKWLCMRHVNIAYN